MATGRRNYLTKQTGEYLVVAELSRRGYIATTFTGNMPEYDIVAVDEAGGHALVQVKTITTDNLQVSNVRHFADIVFEGHRQVVRGARPSPCPALFFVLVRLAPAGSAQRDRFFVLPWEELASAVTDHQRRETPPLAPIVNPTEYRCSVGGRQLPVVACRIRRVER